MGNMVFDEKYYAMRMIVSNTGFLSGYLNAGRNWRSDATLSKMVESADSASNHIVSEALIKDWLNAYDHGRLDYICSVGLIPVYSEEDI